MGRRTRAWIPVRYTRPSKLAYLSSRVTGARDVASPRAASSRADFSPAMVAPVSLPALSMDAWFSRRARWTARSAYGEGAGITLGQAVAGVEKNLVFS